MNKYLIKIATVSFALWGILHIAGGIFLFNSGLTGNKEFIIDISGNSDVMNSDLPLNSNSEYYTNKIFLFHSFNIIWIGILTMLSALILIRKNILSGYFMSLGLAGLSDIGLIVFMVLPGIIKLSDAMPGLILFAAALISSLLDIYRNLFGNEINFIKESNFRVEIFKK